MVSLGGYRVVEVFSRLALQLEGHRFSNWIPSLRVGIVLHGPKLYRIRFMSHSNLKICENVCEWLVDPEKNYTVKKKEEN